MKVKLRAGRYLKVVELWEEKGRIWIKFPFNRILLDEIKSMKNAKWHGFDTPPKKVWSIEDCARNRFQLEYLQGANVYEFWDQPIYIPNTPHLTKMYEHQVQMLGHIATRHYAILACEMGTGKTLPACDLAEHLQLTPEHYFYVGPRSGLWAVSRELDKWSFIIRPTMYTYEGLTKALKNNQIKITPRYVIFDESSKIKNHAAQRSQAAMHLAEEIREEWGDEGYVILMSGTPAPKTPLDWWHQCEVAVPGFLREGNIGKFKARLAVIEERESASGGIYPHIVSWKQDEVLKLYDRMKGLVLVQFKKDCLDLPDKVYDEIQVQPEVKTIRAANLIINTSARAIESLTLLRELSDGFQYQEVEDGTKTCDLCFGSLRIAEPEDQECPRCNAIGEIKKTKRITKEIGTPKDQYFLDLLDEYEDIGRFIVWGGFTGTIDRLVQLTLEADWIVLRLDGRGLHSPDPDLDPDLLLSAMDSSHKDFLRLRNKYPKVCFIGHPRAGGMAITLTASPVELFYSNDFSGEARMQSEDRFHRMGMTRGARIIDLIHLPSDKLVLDNLKLKKNLQNTSMGELQDAFGNVS